ncbi:sulfatase, partial [Aduncisulcus paluster]
MIVHWHDLGRYLGVYGHPDVSSPHLDQLAAEGILFTRAHATAPLCSPSRGSLFTGRYPQSNGLIGLAHHGWEYRAGVRTLPHILSGSGWHTALFGMQHESAYPAKLGFDEYDTHRPFPPERYEPSDAETVNVPDYLPDTPEVRDDLAEFYGSITVADAKVGELLEVLTETGLDQNTWVVFMTDHGPALPRAKSTLYDAGTGISLIVRPPRGRSTEPRRYDELFSGVDLLPTLLELLGVDIPEEVQGVSHAGNINKPSGEPEEVRSEVFTTKTYHDSFDPIRAIRTKNYSYIENYAPRPVLDLPWDIADSPPGRAAHNLLGLDANEQSEAIANDLSLRLNDWREQTFDVIPSDFAGTRISARLLRMSDHPTAYLVLASQRSGSTLLVESLRATGVAGEPQEFFQYLPTTSMSPQPREWFADTQDESILRLLDPLDEGK